MKCSLSGAVLLLFILSSISSGLTSVVFRDYQHIEFGSTWQSAQHFCRQYFDDLATIYTQSDINSVNLTGYFTWVGLHRDSSNGGNWSWSDGDNSHSYDWAENEPDQSDDCAAVFYPNRKFYGEDCNTNFIFTCQKNDITNAEYVSILLAKNWSQAQQICRYSYMDLASFSNSSLNNIITQRDLLVWIGLYRKAGGSWSWSSGMSDYTNWASNEPSNNGDCVAVSSATNKMFTQDCATNSSFVCITNNVFLVKENKSWEEALKHCRGFTSPANSGLHFDLLSVEPGDEHNYVMTTEVIRADTEEVWTGLRFLAGEWLWVNGADVLYSDLPLCPTLLQHCGALSKNNTGSVTAMDCLERKNFLCYSFW